MNRITGAALATLIAGALLLNAAPAQADRPMPGANGSDCSLDGTTKARVTVIPGGRPDSITRVRIRLTRSIDGDTKIRHRVRRLAEAKAIRVRLQSGERVRVEVVNGGRVVGGNHAVLRSAC